MSADKFDLELMHIEDAYRECSTRQRRAIRLALIAFLEGNKAAKQISAALEKDGTP